MPQVQDPKTGKWYDVDQAGLYPSGNIRDDDGTVYSHEGWYSRPGDPKGGTVAGIGGAIDAGGSGIGKDNLGNYNNGSPPDQPLQAGHGWEFDGMYWRQVQGRGLGYSAPNTPRPSGPQPSGGGGGGGGFQSNMGDFGQGNYGDVPDFNAPRWQAPPEFVYDKKFAAPDEAGLQKDPGFQFRLDQGRKALEASAAGKGILRTGGTLKDLVNYGQNFATNEYANVYNRNFNEYKFDYDKEADIYARNYNLKRDVFDRNYKAAYDEYAPKLTGWQTNTNNKARAQEALFNREWQMYLGNQNADLERRRIEQGDVT